MKLSKKLSLGKRSIAILSKDAMAAIEGGETNTAYLCGGPADTGTCAGHATCTTCTVDTGSGNSGYTQDTAEHSCVGGCITDVGGSFCTSTCH